MNKKALIAFAGILVLEVLAQQQRKIHRLDQTVGKLVEAHNREMQRRFDRAFESIIEENFEE